jgi:hypothetical protein
MAGSKISSFFIGFTVTPYFQIMNNLSKKFRRKPKTPSGSHRCAGISNVHHFYSGSAGLGPSTRRTTSAMTDEPKKTRHREERSDVAIQGRSPGTAGITDTRHHPSRCRQQMATGLRPSP